MFSSMVSCEWRNIVWLPTRIRRAFIALMLTSLFLIGFINVFKFQGKAKLLKRIKRSFEKKQKDMLLTFSRFT